MNLFCTQCGAANDATNTRCSACGELLLPAVPASPAAIRPVGSPYDPFASQPPATLSWSGGEVQLPGYGTGSAAGPLERFGAFMFDLMVYGVMAVVLMTVAGALGLAGDTVALLVLLLHPIYFVTFWSTTGQTPGYRAARLQLITTGGTKPTAGSAVIRYLGMQMSQWALYLGCLWMIWDARKQTWHDKMARTLVIRA